MTKFTERLIADVMVNFKVFLEMHTKYVNISFNNSHCGLRESYSEWPSNDLNKSELIYI